MPRTLTTPPRSDWVENSPDRLGVIRRVTRALDLLSAGEVISQAELASAMGVGQRTIRRLMRALAEVHPISTVRTKTVSYRLEKTTMPSRTRTGAEWDAPRKGAVRFRVNDAELEHALNLAAKAGYETVSDYLRSLLDLPATNAGAPTGNKNKKGRPGANQHSKRPKQKG